MRVLILRPPPGGAQTARAVAAQGLDPTWVPLFAVEPVAWSPPDAARYDLVVMTSANAARHAGPGLANYTHLPLLAVGAATRAAAREAGFRDITTGPGTAAALAPLIGGRRALHLAGAEHRAVDGCDAVIVYASVPRVVDRALLTGDAALVHSARAGARLAELAPQRAAMTIIAISPAAAAACGTGWRAVRIAAAPHEAALLATLRASV